MIFLRILLIAAIIVTGAIFLIISYQAWKSTSLPKLKSWHKISIDKELLVGNKYDDINTYLKDEDQFIREMFAKVADSAHGKYNRFNPESPSYPFANDDNLNASFINDPGLENTKGVILLVHGLSDSPYHMRALGQLFMKEGYYVLGLRLPGHGTLPSGLYNVTWQQWAKATQWGASQLHKIASDRGNVPFYMGGFSTGGALILNYSLNAAKDDNLYKPEKLFLFSPAIGVSKMAMFSAWHKVLSWMSYFKQFAWLDILPEYDPAKYNSFPKNAGRQIYLLTLENKRLVEKMAKANRQNELPAMIAFQSLVDATVETNDLLEMYQKIGGSKDELFLFDINQVHKDFMNSELLTIEAATEGFVGTNKPQVHILTNVEKSDSIHDPSLCAVYRLEKNNARIDVYPEQHTPWPKEYFAMSHVAVPISPGDAYYGKESMLGSFSIHGEKEVLFIPSDDFMRLRYNPFFNLMELEILDFLED